MLDNQKYYNIELSENIKVTISRSEINSIKMHLKAGDVSLYDDILLRLSNPVCQLRLCLIPGSFLLMKSINVCTLLPWFIHLFTIITITILSWKLWWWLLLISIAIQLVILIYIQTNINFELGARLFALDHNLKEILDNPEKETEFAFILLQRYGLSTEDFIRLVESQKIALS